MITLERATELVNESLCGLFGHKWGEWRATTNTTLPPLHLSLNDRERDCARCGLHYADGPMERVWHKRWLDEMTRPTLYDRFVAGDAGRTIRFDKRKSAE
jgi:hypothetical protein